MTRKERNVIKKILPQPAGNQSLSLLSILNAIFYVNKTGCPWRYMPHEYPVWSSVYYHFAKWSKDGTLERINVQL